MDLLCDIPVAVGNEELLLNKMSKTPECFIEYCTNVGNSFGKLLESFGDLSAYREARRDFVKTLKCEANLTKIQTETLIDSFVEELSLELIRIFEQYEKFYPLLFAMKVLFLNTRLKMQAKVENDTIIGEEQFSSDICECGFDAEETKTAVHLKDDSAVLIQSAVRMFLVQNLISYHNQSHPKHSYMIDQLQVIYDTVFKKQNRHTVLMRILSNFFHINKNMINIKELFPLYRDLRNYLDLTIINGTLTVVENEWYLVARCTLRVNHDNLNIMIRFFPCDNMKYVVRAIDNDTDEEKEFLINNVCSYDYKSNINGYTIIVYGTSLFTCTFDWRIYICHMKITDKPIIEVSLHKPLYKECVAYNYIPNVNNYISR